MPNANEGDRQEEKNKDMSRKRLVKKVFPKGPRAFVVKTVSQVVQANAVFALI